MMMDYEKTFGKLPEEKPMWVIPIIMVKYEKKIAELQARVTELEKENKRLKDMLKVAEDTMNLVLQESE